MSFDKSKRLALRHALSWRLAHRGLERAPVCVREAATVDSLVLIKLQEWKAPHENNPDCPCIKCGIIDKAHRRRFRPFPALISPS